MPLPQSMSRRLAIALIAPITLLAGCASSTGLRCGAHEQLLVSDQLYFGTEKPGGIVSPSEWSEFLRGVVTPKFPEGLTVWPASGQWRSANGAITREASHVLSLVHAETEAAESAVRAIVTEYKSRFQQEAVLRVRGKACVSF
ncbi:MAG: DUF3574 domain-containing protein [Pseudomonadota bacterium]